MRWSIGFGILAGCVALSLASTTTPKPTTPPPKTPDTLNCTTFNVTLKLMGTSYTNDLQNVYSNVYNDARIELEAGVHQAYATYLPFQKVAIASFSKAPADNKALVTFYLTFPESGTHLKPLAAVIKSEKLGKLACNTIFNHIDCYIPAPVFCSYPCPTLCAPTCASTCCGSYVVPAPPPPPIVVPAPAPSCSTCANPACAPSCLPSCCNTQYMPSYSYGKRHEAPKPEKKAKSDN